ncbi:MAG: zincin-like metallopeptidase domain-containing protein [Aestuariivirga sp.]
MGNTFSRDTIYREITDKIIAELEQGIVPWVRPWTSPNGLAPLALPQNALTKRSYSGINILLLWSALDERGFVSPHWLTFKQALAMGGTVRKGERGTHVYFADKFVPEKERQKARDDGSDPAAVHFLKRYTVFNVEQCDGLPGGLYVPRAPMPECECIPHAEALIKASGADFRVGGDQAFYVPSEDFIRIPHQSAFEPQINYYRTAFHELGHWTGHKTRLARNLTTKFGTVDYAREELVAEMATAFVCASLGIVPTVRHADYIGNWLQVLKEDARAIVKAASLASKASDFILQFQSRTVEPEQVGAAA